MFWNQVTHENHPSWGWEGGGGGGVELVDPSAGLESATF